MQHITSKPQKKKRPPAFFYIVYEINTIYKFPVGCFDNIQEIGEFFGHDMVSMRSILSRHRNGKRSKPLILNRFNKKFYFVKQWRVINDKENEVEEIPIYKDQDPEDFYIRRIQDPKTQKYKDILVYEGEL